MSFHITLQYNTGTEQIKQTITENFKGTDDSIDVPLLLLICNVTELVTRFARKNSNFLQFVLLSSIRLDILKSADQRKKLQVQFPEN